MKRNPLIPYALQVAILADSCTLLVWAAAERCSHCARGCPILPGPNNEPSAYDPCNRPEVCRLCRVTHVSNLIVSPLRALVKLMTLVKIRSFSTTKEEIWLDEWTNPLARETTISDPNEFIASLQRPVSGDGSVLGQMT